VPYHVSKIYSIIPNDSARQLSVFVAPERDHEVGLSKCSLDFQLVFGESEIIMRFVVQKCNGFQNFPDAKMDSLVRELFRFLRIEMYPENQRETDEKSEQSQSG
jgi:hypothetical protein